MTIPTILPIELKTHIDAAEPVTIIDVRTPLEFQEVHAHGAVNIPLDELEAEKLSSFVNPESKTVYLICRSGGRGKKACEKLLAKGPWQPINIEGGTQGWEAAGLPVHRGKKNHVTGTTGSYRGRFAGRSGLCSGSLCHSLRLRTGCLCRSRSRLCRCDRYLCHGIINRSHALEFDSPLEFLVQFESHQPAGHFSLDSSSRIDH